MKRAEDAFYEPPTSIYDDENEYLSNDQGLCQFFEDNFYISEDQMKALLNDDDLDWYIFADGYPQEDIYKYEYEHLYYVRHDFAYKRRKQIEWLLKNPDAIDEIKEQIPEA
jgi:hypothetical protein